MTIDPLAEKYYNISPYAYVGNNPLKYIDPTGMAIDDYRLNSNGEIELIERTKDKFDRLIAENGSSITVSKNKNGESVLSDLADNSKTFENSEVFATGKRIAGRDETGKSFERIEYPQVKGNYAVTKSEHEALKVFVFAAKNSTVEWGVNNYKNGDWVVGTLRQGSQAPNFSAIDGINYTLANTLYDAHSHGGTVPSYNFQPSSNDNSIASKILQHNPNATVKLFMPQNPRQRWLNLPAEKKVY